MTSSYYPEESWDDWSWQEEEYGEPIYPPPNRPPVQLVMLLLVAVVVLIMVVGLNALVGVGNDGSMPFAAVPDPNAAVPNPPAASVPLNPPAPNQNATTSENDVGVGAPVAPDLDAFASPYDEYIVTQGIHGQSYGHAAVDIAGGKGAQIRSPITGVVTERYVDPIGNTVLTIENDAYKVTFLHGLYTVEFGAEVKVGDPIGTESNQGNTRDMLGRSCRNRDCGYHSHLNVFDKRLGQNVNPLDLLEN